MPAMWKQQHQLHPTFDKINRCLAQDWFLLPHELKLQRAHARALQDAGILSPSELAEVRNALDRIESQFARADCPESSAEDLHTWVETELTERIGEPGRKIHTARSRNDQVATLLRMFVIQSAETIAADLRQLVGLICRRAHQWSDLPFPLQTHSQFAAPGNVGFWALRYAAAFDRARTHLSDRVPSWRRDCPLGAGAVAGSSIPIDRNIQAHELGFAQPSPNALDSTSTRDECLELLAIAAQAALHLQSLATDIIGFSQTPLSWTLYPREFATGSSMMPNKSNPDAMELLRGEANAVIGAHSHAILILKGLPSGYNRDLQCIKPVVRGAVEQLRTLLSLAAAFIEKLDFDARRLADSLRLGDIGATLRMERRVLEGAPLRDAHHAVAAESLSNATAHPDPIGCDAYRTAGSANPDETRRAAAELLASLQTQPPD